MPWQSRWTSIKQVNKEQRRGHELDQGTSTGERTGQGVEVFFIHAPNKNKNTPISTSLHEPPQLVAVQVIGMSLITVSTHSHINACVHYYPGVHGDMKTHAVLASQHTHTHTAIHNRSSHFKITSVCLFRQSADGCASHFSERILKSPLIMFPTIGLRVISRTLDRRIRHRTQFKKTKKQKSFSPSKQDTGVFVIEPESVLLQRHTDVTKLTHAS